MSKQAKPAVIGAFVLGGLVTFILAILFFGSGRMFIHKEIFLLYFNESVNGLNIGAPVKFKGVVIGSVTDIRIQYNQSESSDAIPVFIEVDTDRLRTRLGVKELDLSNPEHLKKQIRLGLRGKLEAQSYVTGMLYIELDYHPSENAVLVQKKQEEYLEIPTVTSNVQEIMRSVMEMLASINKIDYGGISTELKGTLRQVRLSLEKIDFAKLNENVISATDGLDEIIHSEEIRDTLANVAVMSENLREMSSSLKANIAPLSAQMRTSLEVVESAMTEVERAIRPESALRIQLETTLREFGRAAAAMRALTDYLERNPGSLVRGKATPEENK